MQSFRSLLAAGGTGFYPDGVLLGGVTRDMAEQYAPDQLQKGLLKVQTLGSQSWF